MESSEKDVEHETIEQVESEFSVPEPDRALEKRLLWKLDLHVVPILMLLFLFAFLDRINIGNARLQGLEKDLNMKGRDYNIALLIFFVPYVLLEVPSNLVLKKFAPSWWLSGIMFGWGRFYCPALPWGC
jgi:fucose permease